MRVNFLVLSCVGSHTVTFFLQLFSHSYMLLQFIFRSFISEFGLLQ